MRRAVLCCLLAACSFDHGKPALGDGGIVGGDAPDSRMIDAPSNCTTYSTQVDTCATGVGLGTMNVDLSGTNSYDTDNGVLTTPQGVLVVPHDIVTTPDGPIDVLFVASFTLQADAKFRVTGAQFDRAFGIASLGAVQIDGTIDLSANGAGARDDNDCTSDGVKGTDDDGGGGGGGGGGFGGNGGN
ncbi:MAG: hypothetical protein HOV81_11215, partial [Kofleriaceae bacterium]|nr:hypothetical protein [Kofleriaceae bacterium]